MQARSQFNAGADGRHSQHNGCARLLVLSLIGATLIPLVGCSKLGAPTGLDASVTSQLAPAAHSSQQGGADPNTSTARRAPFDPVTAPENVQVLDDVNWAWNVTWDASTGDVAKYQIFEYNADTAEWDMLIQTKATHFMVPLLYAPQGISVRVRAVNSEGLAGDFSEIAHSPAHRSSDGGGGGIRRNPFE